MKKLATLALLCSAAGFSTYAHAASPAGYYCESAQYDIVDTTGTCEAPAQKDPVSGKCMAKFTGTDYLNVTEKDNGDLEFSLFLIYDYAHSCGLDNETAKKIDDNTWLFEKELAPNSSNPWENCSIKITYSADGFELQSPNENATCKGVCGYRGNLKDIKFPINLKDTAARAEKKECSHQGRSVSK